MSRLAHALLTCALVVAALATPVAAGPPPAVQADAYIVRGAPDGAVLAGRNTDVQRPVASITKLMTVLVALEHASLDDVVTVPAAATRIGESTVQLRPGERLTVRELAQAALIPSANDAATALGLHVGRGSLPRFVALMNAKARELGMSGTRYVQPHGLDTPGHVSTAADSVRLLRAALRVPFIRETVRTQSATISGGRTLVSTDDLLGGSAIHRGGKTGHTDLAGWSQVAEARRKGVTIQAGVLGAPSREQRNADLLALESWALAQYRPVKIVDAARTYATATAPYGLPNVPIVAPSTIVRLARVERPLLERMVVTSNVELPIRKGQRLGEVRIYDGRRLVARSPLVAARATAEPGTIDKVQWYATRTVENLWDMLT